MTRFGVLLLALPLAGIAGAAPPRDRSPLAGERLVGTWACSGALTPSRASEIYSRADDGTITLENRVVTSSGKPGIVEEVLAYDSALQRWTLSAPSNIFFGGLHLSGPDWSGDTWMLSGTESAGDRAERVRLVYSALDPETFRRAHQVQTGSVWHEDAAYLCRRQVASAIAVPVAAQTARAPATPPAARGTMVPALAEVAPLPTRTPAVSGSAAAWKFGSAVSAASPTGWKFAPAPSPTPPAASPTPATRPRSSATAHPEPTPHPESTLHPESTPHSGATAPQAKAPRPATARPATARPTTVAVPGARSGDAAPPDDRAGTLAGDWTCETIAGARSTHAYRSDGPGDLTLRNAVTIAGHVYPIEETYRYDGAQKRWTNVTQGGSYRATAAAWTGPTWTFEGLETDLGKPQRVRMTYATLGATAFRREFARSTGDGRWLVFTSETCRRR